jgi:hypothetical protein
MTQTARWSLKVSAQTDRELRMHLAANGGKKGDISRYVEESVNRRLLFEIVDDVRTRNADRDPVELQRLVDEAVGETRETFWIEHRR